MTFSLQDCLLVALISSFVAAALNMKAKKHGLLIFHIQGCDKKLLVSASLMY